MDAAAAKTKDNAPSMYAGYITVGAILALIAIRAGLIKP